MRSSTRLMGIAMLGAGLWVSRPAQAAEITSELGALGEVPAWLIVKAPDAGLEKDPFAPMGGEAAYAAMTNGAPVPACGAPLEIPGTNAGQKIRIGDGVWEGTRMALPEMPGIWNEYPRLTVPDGYRYAYCRLDSPRAMQANLLSGLNRGLCRMYLNGHDLGTFKGGWGWEFAREVPIALKQGGNHLLVRFAEGAVFACRVVGANAEPLHEVKVTVNAPNAEHIKAPLPPPAPESERLVNLATNIPPPAPALQPEFLGAHLGRTMALLESGKHTHRPVRIIFSGQSIETGWTWMLVQRLRERFPGTKIMCENRAIGGWFAWRMHKLMKHDILRWQPDLVLFSAYQGNSETWDRLLGDLRRETTADIVIRTQHIDAFAPEKPANAGGSEPDCLRALAAKYNVELVEVRQEWLDYLNANALAPKDLLRDKIHLNAKGETLMALLYERHFVRNPAAAGWADTERHFVRNPAAAGWADRVQRFDVGAFLEDNRTDGIVLEGAGWSGERIARSNSADDRLRLKFHGTRVDLVLPQGHGRARILIDGKKPSELNLYHGTRPQERTFGSGGPNMPMTYHTGPNMQPETWLLTLTEGNVDADPKKANQRLKFRLSGSKTGFDGEGCNDRKFVSNSGRITLLQSDWTTRQGPSDPAQPAVQMQAFTNQPQVVWHILPDSRDEVPFGSGWRETACYYFGLPYDYVTVADGLPGGVHELTLIPIPDPNPQRAFTIMGADVHRPPLAREATEWTGGETGGN